MNDIEKMQKEINELEMMLRACINQIDRKVLIVGGKTHHYFFPKLVMSKADGTTGQLIDKAYEMYKDGGVSWEQLEQEKMQESKDSSTTLETC